MSKWAGHPFYYQLAVTALLTMISESAIRTVAVSFAIVVSFSLINQVDKATCCPLTACLLFFWRDRKTRAKMTFSLFCKILALGLLE
jgi:hypothetical protein